MIKEGMIIEGPFWNEPVEIKKIEEFSEQIRIIGATIYSKKHIDHLLSREKIEKLRVSEFILDFSAKASQVFLVIEALRLRFASVFDPLLAMNVSKIDPLPFQIEAVYDYILKLPRIRFLIADDPGAGKTIMAGLIIKELKLRGICHRILIVVPGHLKYQWQRELKERFQEAFTIIDRNFFNVHYIENPWQKENQVITSMDFAKREEILPSLISTSWDLIVVDEAHKMAAYKHKDKLSKTDRYKLGEILSKITEHLIFLTATPHKGDPENYRLFLDLLLPGFFATKELIYESIKNKDNPLFIRRLKEDLRDFKGRPIFTRRYSKTVKFSLSRKEKELYNELSKYVISQYNKALQIDKKRNIAFALLILQRRMASSTYALLKSLERRKEKLSNLFKEPKLIKENVNYIDDEEIGDYEEERCWEQENNWETLSIAENKEELKEEINTLNILIEKAREIINEEQEVKLKELKKAINEGFKKIREIQGNEKILIFTESKDTMEYLVNKIESWGYSVSYIHGGMKLDERISAERDFRQRKQIMVATEAAGEGINLQFCHIMINYDIPWNPNRLEQRMGRIHRYGQQKDVYIFNLIAGDTREGQVLSKIFDKLEEIKDALGSDKVFDVIGDVFQGIDLYHLILDAVSNSKNINEIIKEIDIRIDNEYIEKVKFALGESLATKHIDYVKVNEMAQKAKEYRLAPEYIEEFFKKAFEKAGGNFKVEKNGFIVIYSIPIEIAKIAEEIGFKIDKKHLKITFDKEIAFRNSDCEFISLGHPLFEALIEWVNRNYINTLQKGAIFEDLSCRYNGVLWFFEGEVKDGKGNTVGKRIMAIYDNGKELKEVNPSILWDLVPVDTPSVINYQFPILDKEKVQKYCINILEAYEKEILEERKRQTEIKKKYGIKSLEYLINEIDEQLTKFYEKENIIELDEKEDKNYRLDIFIIKEKKKRKEQYEKALKMLLKEIEQEVSLVICMPKFLGAILIQPSTTQEIISNEMVSDEEIERIGMEVAMEYERNCGRIPEDVSKENLGFDIRSKSDKEIRYIEVKARKNEGQIVLTPNEWFKAKRFKEQYWLYIVANVAKNPVLYIINNPAENLKVQQKIEITRYIVPLDEWKNKGVKEG